MNNHGLFITILKKEGLTMRGLMLLANGFEDTEGLSTRDVLVRSGIEMVTASITSDRQVVSSFGIVLLTDTIIDKVNVNDFDFLVLPGGGRGTANLKASEKVSKLVLDFASKNKFLCAICAAPGVLGRLGLLKDKHYTCFAGCQDGEGLFTGNEVEAEGNVITGRSMMYSIPFALAIVEKLLGEDSEKKVMIGLMGKEPK